MKKLILIVLFTILGTIQVLAQSRENLEAINELWNKFYLAFEQLDYTLMAEIHSEELVRISGGSRISDYKSYIDNYKLMFQNAKDNHISNKIELRFFERINNDSVASERGVYKLTRVSQDKEQSYYGQFHVLFRKEAGRWKILMDYDSSEGGAIGEDDFNKAYHIDDLEAFSGG